MDTFEFAVRKDIRNKHVSPVLDTARQRELWHWLGIGVPLAGVLVFSVWQQVQLALNGYRLEELQQALANEQARKRQLTLKIETLRAPARIERLATAQLHLVAPTESDTIITPRMVSAPPPPASVVAAR